MRTLKKKYFAHFWEDTFGVLWLDFLVGERGSGIRVEVDDDCFEEVWDQVLAEFIDFHGEW